MFRFIVRQWPGSHDETLHKGCHHSLSALWQSDGHRSKKPGRKEMG